MKRCGQIAKPVVDLCRAPDGTRDRQLLLGDRVEILAQSAGWSHVRSAKDDYEGFVYDLCIAPEQEQSHWVCAPATHTYQAADFKSPDVLNLSFGSRVAVLGWQGRFARTSLGFIPASHLKPLPESFSDPVTVAELFLGTPYLWGGNSRFGVDCSGLVQMACLACDRPCPGDSGPQEASLGHLCPSGTSYTRGDLLFWKGHVAWVRDERTLLHANAFSMSVTLEPIDAAITRISDQGDGPVTAHKRIV